MARDNIQPKESHSPWPWIAFMGIAIAAIMAMNRPVETPPTPEYDGVCFVAGNVSNSPTPDFSDATKYVKTVLEATQTNETPNICMYSATSDPYAIELRGIEPKAGSSSGLDSQEKTIIASVNKAAKTSPTKPGANYFDAIREAAGYLKSNGSNNPLVVVYGSGLSDEGVLNFAFDGKLLSDKNQSEYVLSKLSANNVPKNNLSGVTVEWYGAGKVVNENGQEDLGSNNENIVKTVYESALNYIGIASSLGKSFHDTNVSGNAKSIDNSLFVNPTHAPGTLKPGITLHLTEKHAKFNPNEATLINHDSVVTELTSFAEEFNSDPSLHLKITGYHAKCAGSSDKDLSLRRANTIKDILVKNLGVNADRIQTYGVGGPQDEREEGSCASAIAAEHRVVIVETY